MAYQVPRCSHFRVEKQCPVCDTKFTPDNRAQIYCSLPCRTRAQTNRDATATGKPHWSLTGKICKICGKHFMPGTKMSSNAKYCSDACRVEGIRTTQKRFKQLNPEAQSIYNRARDMTNGRKDTLQRRLYAKYPDLPRVCETPNCREARVLEAAHKPGFERKGADQVMKFYERHMFWMLCPTCHRVLDKGIETPEQMGLR